MMAKIGTASFGTMKKEAQDIVAFAKSQTKIFAPENHSAKLSPQKFNRGLPN
jgi:hypothetical protein